MKTCFSPVVLTTGLGDFGGSFQGLFQDGVGGGNQDYGGAGQARNSSLGG